MKNPIELIDYNLLKRQKNTLLNLKLSIEEQNDIDGIILMIDNIQDYAFDILNKKEVF